MNSDQATDATSGAGRWVKMSAAGTQPRTAENEAVDASVQRDVRFANAIAYI
jgi:hypothetical protein